MPRIAREAGPFTAGEDNSGPGWTSGSWCVREDKLRTPCWIVWLTGALSLYLSGPATLAQQWDHRPDLEFSQNVGACDPEVADRYREHVPK